MARKCFLSFHYMPDCFRAGQVRNMGMIEGNVPVSDNDWETVKRGGDPAIERWISSQMFGRSCTVVLVGAGTAGRKWINHEIVETWKARKRIVGVRIHNLKDAKSQQSLPGSNPFDQLVVGGTMLGPRVILQNPPYSDSKAVYDYIKTNLPHWVEAAVAMRAALP
jgi:hypothetical protein